MADKSYAHDFSANRAEPACAGEDLKDMLSLLSRQFAEADERNAVALGDVRARIETLGRSAESVREQVPPQYAPAFARIEDSVQLLAQQIAEISREREATKAAAASSSFAAEPVQSPLPPVVPSLVEADRTEAAAPPVAAMLAPAVSIPGDAMSPWDREAADALARLYDTAMIAPSETPPPAVDHAKPALAAGAEPAPVVDAAGSAAGFDHHDRAWLEERFAAIAARVEQSLAEMRPDHAIMSFDGRIDQLEQRFSTALEGVASRTDVEGLRLVEAHISELAVQFDQARSQLERIDMIERHLGDLMHQVSDERFAELFAHAAPASAGPTDAEIDAMALAVADRVSGRMLEPVHGAADAGSISDLKRVIETFVSGQRESEEHTATMLDTMQQAMIRMLDRMDAIEQSAPGYGSAGFVAANHVAPAAPIDADSHHEPALDPMPSFEQAEPALAEQPVARENARASVIADARRAARKAAQTGEPDAAPKPEGSSVRRGAPAVELSARPSEPQSKTPQSKTRSRVPLMVAGIALVAAVGLLAASVGLNRFSAGTASVQQAVQPKAPLTIDNGAQENTAAELPDATGKTGGAAAPAAPGGNGTQAPGSRIQNMSQPDSERQQPEPEQTAASNVVPAGSPASANPIGVVVTPASASAQAGSDLARMRQQRNLASLASQLAMVQAKAPTLPSSMLPVSDATVSQPTTEVDATVKMPPVQIGPSSLRLAAQKGDPSAEFEVAARFAEGRGVPQDFRQAMTWYGRAAQRGFAPAQYRLGTLYERGIGAPADLARAKIWYGRAADQGHIKAMHNLAVLNAGNDAGADYGTAVRWFTAAAERGLADSQYNLGVLYESGLGLQRDLKLAYQWLSLAARTGDKEAGRRREQVRMKLEEAEAAAIDQLVNNWQPQASDPMVNEARAAGEAWKQRQASR